MIIWYDSGNYSVAHMHKRSLSAKMLLTVNQRCHDNVGKQFYETIDSWKTTSMQNTELIEQNYPSNEF